MGLALFGSLAWALDYLPPHSKVTIVAAILFGLLLVAAFAIYGLTKQHPDNDRQQDGGTQNNQIVPLLNAVINENRAYHRERYRQEQNKQLRDWVTVAALVAAGTFAAMQWAEMSAVYQPISEQAQAAHDAFIAANRAWVGPVSATVPKIEKGKGLEVTLKYLNSGREPALDFGAIPNLWISSIKDWNSGAAADKIINWKNVCFGVKQTIPSTRVAYPSGNLNANYDIKIKTDDQAAASKILVNDALISGDEIFVYQQCFIYRSIGTPHHSAACHFYNAKATILPDLSICTVGNDAD